MPIIRQADRFRKEMIDLGFKLVTISSDFRSMSAHAQSVIDVMKDKLDFYINGQWVQSESSETMIGPIRNSP